MAPHATYNLFVCVYTYTLSCCTEVCLSMPALGQRTESSTVEAKGGWVGGWGGFHTTEFCLGFRIVTPVARGETVRFFYREEQLPTHRYWSPFWRHPCRKCKRRGAWSYAGSRSRSPPRRTDCRREERNCDQSDKASCTTNTDGVILKVERRNSGHMSATCSGQRDIAKCRFKSRMQWKALELFKEKMIGSFIIVRNYWFR